MPVSGPRKWSVVKKKITVEQYKEITGEDYNK